MKVTSENYVQLACNTESPVTEAMKERFNSEKNIRLLHAGIGLATESGEFIDMLKKHLYYGKELDLVNLIEEISDIFWYCAIACDALEVDMNKVMQINIEKLAARYPDRFTEEAAINRDLETERKILEQ